MKSILKTISINILTLIILGFVLEFSIPYFFHFDSGQDRQAEDLECADKLKISYVDSQGSDLIRDRSIGFFLNPSARNVNDQGFFGDCVSEQKDGNEFRIAAIGDSFTASIQVPFNKTWPVLLQQSLSAKMPSKKVSIFNYAAGGHGVDQQLEQVSYAVQNHQPDLIVQSLYLGNDFTDSSYELFKRYQSPHKNFANKNYVLLNSSGFVEIEHKIDYYMFLNFFDAFRYKKTIYINDDEVNLNLKWKPVESQNLTDYFSINLNYFGLKYDFVDYEYYPFSKYNSQDIALNLRFKNTQGASIELQVLRHDPSCFDWLEKRVFVRLSAFDASGLSTGSSIVETSKPQSEGFIPVEAGCLEGTLKRGENSSDWDRLFFWRSRLFFGSLFNALFSDVKEDQHLNFNFERLRNSENDLEVPYIYHVFFEQLPEFTKRDLSVFKHYLNKVSDWQNAGKIPYIVSTIPAAVSVVPSYWGQLERAYFSTTTGAYGRAMPEVHFTNVTKVLGLNYKSFFDHLQGLPLETLESFYDLRHRHFTELGHAEYARYLESIILSRQEFSGKLSSQ